MPELKKIEIKEPELTMLVEYWDNGKVFKYEATHMTFHAIHAHIFYANHEKRNWTKEDYETMAYERFYVVENSMEELREIVISLNASLNIKE